MMIDTIEPIREHNLSIAWARAFLRVMERGVDKITPLIVTVDGVTNHDVAELEGIRQALDTELLAQGEFQIETVASTIFPKSLWNPKRDQDLLYERYLKIWPKIKRYQQNRRGTYFKRLIDFENDDRPVNQLRHIIRCWRSGLHRHSALQASVFDPRRDHVRSKTLGFPCLHQVALTPVSMNGKSGLIVTGFYATQHIFEKAYGNYLGLCRLGQFMARQMGLELVGLTCIAAKGKRGDYPKGSLEKLRNKVAKMVDAYASDKGLIAEAKE